MSTAAGLGTKGMPQADRRHEIVAAATAEFAEHGFAGASMAEIARTAGISKALIYQHFDTKEHLYLACFRRIAEPLVARIRAELDGGDAPFSVPIKVLNGIFETLGPQRAAWRVFYDPTAPRSGETGSLISHYRRHLTDFAVSGVAGFLGALGDDDARDVDALATVWTAIVDAVVGWAIAHPEETVEDLTARWERIITAIFSIGARPSTVL
ncbi:TetR/AcrR family transcriptional regulator [Amycolatopsis alkalitolerans]|uniref:TetR/AcrR family transcriptional regulator n=1 Tax=Amycolatopsis alkalitolerans TaxID=2547244 RepID=A0A5C4M3W1_9PSEU|nr:TetR/AcrR family transcriptional regulator [Amycolatopsis alkalitolerans]TNC25844.1 TetR/AcrR family transcriptional regulator [Amycolatopsis alkalitolerans]